MRDEGKPELTVVICQTGYIKNMTWGAMWDRQIAFTSHTTHAH